MSLLPFHTDRVRNKVYSSKCLRMPSLPLDLEFGCFPLPLPLKSILAALSVLRIDSESNPFPYRGRSGTEGGNHLSVI